MILIFHGYVRITARVYTGNMGGNREERQVRLRKVGRGPMVKTSTCQKHPQVLQLSFKFK